jgi:hypothetical protein
MRLQGRKAHMLVVVGGLTGFGAGNGSAAADCVSPTVSMTSDARAGGRPQKRPPISTSAATRRAPFESGPSHNNTVTAAR